MEGQFQVQSLQCLKQISVTYKNSPFYTSVVILDSACSQHFFVIVSQVKYKMQTVTWIILLLELGILALNYTQQMVKDMFVHLFLISY